MSIKKGDLVMTEPGLAWYEDAITNHIIIANQYNHGVIALNGVWTVSINASPATRPQVEAYLKEKGWRKVKRNDNYIKDGQLYWLKFQDFTHPYSVLDTGITNEDFDTAPAQLTEAILMAKLLNATKP